jgi:hypothetical protein
MIRGVYLSSVPQPHKQRSHQLTLTTTTISGLSLRGEKQYSMALQASVLSLLGLKAHLVISGRNADMNTRLAQMQHLQYQLHCRCSNMRPAIELAGTVSPHVSLCHKVRSQHAKILFERGTQRAPPGQPRFSKRRAHSTGPAVRAMAATCGALPSSVLVANHSTGADDKDSLKRVAVIGSGVSGLAAAKAFLQEGLFEVTIFEQQGELGGLWVKAYNTARIQNGKPMYEFSDWPMPDSYPHLPSKEQIKKYLSSYACRFNITDHIQFRTRVARMDRSGETG